jgi:DNA-binding NarL/FixJ family response regulator
MSGVDEAENIRVLIADDDARVRTALRSFLSASPGFDVVGEAGTSALAVELVRQHTPAVAIVGIAPLCAPEGLDVLRAITRELRIPAVAMSTQAALRRPALAAGACRFLQNDTSLDALLQALRAAVRISPGDQP